MTELKKLFETHVDTTVKQQALYIIQRYLDAGYECWIVGGPVRDLLLGLSPKDIDFATNCPLEVTKTLFASVIPTGEDHGTLTIHLDGENYEVTRYRKDVDTDGRRATIEYAETIQEDVLRRDLTVNAIAFNPITDEIVDAVGGLKDFETRTLRFVGNTKDRVLEDMLRVIRFYRFYMKLKPYNFKIDKDDLNIFLMVYNPMLLSVERIYQEFDNIFEILSNDESLKKFIITEFKKLKILKRFNVSESVYNEIFDLCDYFPLIYHVGLKNFNSLKISKKYKVKLQYFEQTIGKNFNNSIEIKNLLCLVSGNIDLAKKILKYHKYYNTSVIPQNIKITLMNIVDNDEPYMITHLDIDGNYLIERGYCGKEIGIVLEKLLEIVKSEPNINTKCQLEEILKVI